MSRDGVARALAPAAPVVALGPLDRSTLAYAAFAMGVVLARWPDGRSPGPAPLVLLHAALAAAALGAPRVRRTGRVGAFVADFYPLFITTALYLAVGVLNRAAGVAHDALVQGWEQTLFGGQPSVLWIRAHPSPVLSTALHFGYLSYFFIVGGAVVAPWLAGRRGAANEIALLTMRAFYCCWAIFLVFPVAGPRHTFPPADNAATHTALAVLAHSVVDDVGAAAWGSAFPSSHVAASMVAAFAAARRWPALGAVLLPLFVLLALGTVYGQFHYAVDALGGLLLGAAVLLLGPRPAASVATP